MVGGSAAEPFNVLLRTGCVARCEGRDRALEVEGVEADCTRQSGGAEELSVMNGDEGRCGWEHTAL